MFSEKSLTILQQIAGITNSVIIKYPYTIAISPARDMYVYWNLKNDEKEEEWKNGDGYYEVPLNDGVSEFISMFKLFDPESRSVTISENLINLSDKNGFAASYIMANKLLMQELDKTDEQFNKTEGIPSVCTFDLTVEDIKKLNSALGVFKNLGSIIFEGNEGLKISIGNVEKFNARTNTFSIKKNDVSVDKEFSISLPRENFLNIPCSDYTVEIKYNEKVQKNNYRVIMKSKTIPDFKLMLAIKQ